MEKIVISEDAVNRLNELIRILFDEDYFGFMETAIEYAQKIYNFIETIPTQQQKPTQNSRHGSFYCRYKANNRTDWYILFDKEQDQYLVRNIINNHTREYPFYISYGKK